jgi:hypothetical protein
MAQQRTLAITDEMLSLFERGLQLVAAGHDDVDDDSAAHWEFVRLAKKLEWELIKLPMHAVSIFDRALDGPPPSYLKPSHAMYIDWDLARSWRRALQAACETRGYHTHWLPSACSKSPCARRSGSAMGWRASEMACCAMVLRISAQPRAGRCRRSETRRLSRAIWCSPSGPCRRSRTPRPP